jgi:hypothetical protein
MKKKSTENIESSEEVVDSGLPKSGMMTLYNAYMRGVFSKDPEENLKIYMQKRKGYEGRERRTLIKVI